jgi:hypothetical protein
MKRIIAVCAFCLLTAPAFSGERMTNEELRAFYTGKTLTAVHHKNGPGKTYFGADGSAHSIADSGKERVGKWWIDEDKNMRCVRWDDAKRDFCRYTERNADGTYSLIHPKSGKLLVEFTASVDGNQL